MQSDQKACVAPALKASRKVHGVMLLNSEGTVILCDRHFIESVGVDFTGKTWSEITGDFLLCEEGRIAQLFEHDRLQRLTGVMESDGTVHEGEGRLRFLHLTITPIWSSSDNVPEQVVVSITEGDHAVAAECGHDKGDAANGSGDLDSNDAKSREQCDPVQQSQTIEAQLRQSREEWEKTFDALPDSVTIQDVQMRIVKANRAACDLFGVANRDELIGRYCYELFQDNSHQCDRCPVTETRRDYAVHNGIVYNKRLDKTFDIRSSPIYNEQGQPQWIVQIVRDITANLKQEEERRLLSAAIEQASESVMITDRDGRLLYVNPAFCATTGYSREETLGQKTDILHNGAQDQNLYEDMWYCLNAGKVWRGRLTSRKKNGSLFKEDTTISPIVDSSGEITNYIALKRDITREESLEQQLRQAMKMEAIGTLAGGIAHDFNNILSVIIGFSQIAKQKLAEDHPVQADLDQVLTGSDRAVDLVKQILTFARQDSRQQLRPLKVQYIIKEVIKLLRSSLPTTIKIVQNVDVNCQSIMADPSQIHQLLMNLCTNARQAIGDDHGTISISLMQHEANEVLAKGTGARTIAGRYLQLTVSDTGCGMDRSMVQRIFDPFFTTREKEYGTGLGLAVVHGIVKRHRGQIVVDSNPGEGTTFNIYFSIPETEEEKSVIVEPSVGKGDERILLVDDEEGVGLVHERILSSLGYRVRRFKNSAEALTAFRNAPDSVDLVITDMTMPNMTGTELALQMMAIRPDLPVILVTGYSEAVDRKKAMEMGIREFLMKPLKEESFSLAIRKVLGSS